MGNHYRYHSAANFRRTCQKEDVLGGFCDCWVQLDNKTCCFMNPERGVKGSLLKTFYDSEKAEEILGSLGELAAHLPQLKIMQNNCAFKILWHSNSGISFHFTVVPRVVWAILEQMHTLSWNSTWATTKDSSHVHPLLWDNNPISEIFFQSRSCC